jgi:hypothetical protein
MTAHVRCRTVLQHTYCSPVAPLHRRGHLQALPSFLRALLDRLQAAGVFTSDERPNHCLVNSYERAAACPLHQDGPLCACFNCSMLPIPSPVLLPCCLACLHTAHCFMLKGPDC